MRTLVFCIAAGFAAAAQSVENSWFSVSLADYAQGQAL